MTLEVSLRRTLRSSLLCLAIGVFSPANPWAAKVIMKDGKIYEGKILAETKGDVVIKTSGWDHRIKLLPADNVLTVVHDPHEPEKPADPQRYIAVDSFLTGNIYTTRDVSRQPAPGLRVGGGLRLHPLVE